MRKTGIILIVAILTTPNCNKDKTEESKKITNSISTIYEQIDKYAVITPFAGLELRAKPDTDSKVLILMPFGSLVDIADNNGPEETINNKKSNWYKVQYLNKAGWAFGGYLFSGDKPYLHLIISEYKKFINEISTEKNLLRSKDLHPSNIPVALYKSSLAGEKRWVFCNGEPVYKKIKIVLHPGKAVYTLIEFGNYTTRTTVQRGTYKIIKDQIRITLKPGTMQIEELENKKTTHKTESKIVTLKYYEELNGFLDPKWTQQFGNKLLYHNKKKKYLILKNEEIHKRACEKNHSFEDYIVISYYRIIAK